MRMLKKQFLLRLALFLVVVSLLPSLALAKQAKYVFLFIGDGMGLPQRSAAAEFIQGELLMDSFPAQGITSTYAADRFITGSAPAATAMASGQKTNIGVVGLDTQLRPVKTLAEMAKEQGKKVGIVSSVSIDHATPAAFYAHVKARGQYYDIDVALAESGFDYFAGGGLKDPDNSRDNSANYVGNALDLAKENGYTLINSKPAFAKLGPADGKVLAWNDWLQNSKALPYEMDQRQDQDISLKEFTAKGIELLDNEKGFFMMVEGGKIDWACHANDATAAIHDTLAFDAALNEAYTFYEQHPEETLIVVTGDHECGGLTLGFAGTKYATNFEVLGKQKISFRKFAQQVLPDFKENGEVSFADIKPVIEDNFGLRFDGPAEDPMTLVAHEVAQIKEAFGRSMGEEKVASEDKRTYLLYGGYDPLAVTLTHILDQKAGMGWTSYKHTGVPVSTSAIGVGAKRFNGSYDNTDIATKIMESMGIAPKVYLATN